MPCVVPLTVDPPLATSPLLSSTASECGKTRFEGRPSGTALVLSREQQEQRGEGQAKLEDGFGYMVLGPFVEGRTFPL